MSSPQLPSQRAVLGASVLTSFLSPFALSAVNIALPDIQKHFGVDAVALSWIASTYLLATAIFLIPAGKIGDLYGRKRVLSWGVGLFTLGTVGAALAPSFGALLACRALQGAGGAFMVSTGFALLSSVFSPGERGKALGVNVAAVYIGSSAGPFIGGWLTTLWGWQGVFALNALMGGISLGVILRIPGEWADPTGKRPDILGAALYGGAIAALLLGASSLPRFSGFVLGGIGILGMGLFIRRMMSSEDPLFEVRLFSKNRLFAFSCAAALVNYAATFATGFLLSLYLQYMHRLSPREAGLVLMLQPVLQALVSPLAGRLSDRMEPRFLASTGMALTAAGLATLSCLTARSSLVPIWGALGLLGLGFGLFSSPNANALMGAVPRRYYGQASSAASTMRILGQILSMASVSLAFSLFLGNTPITPALHEAFLSALRLCFGGNALLCAIGIGWSWSRGSGRPAEERPA